MIARTAIVAVIALCLGFAGYLAASRNANEDSRAESPVQRKDLLRAPEFDDVSAFDDGDVGRIDAWLREQVALGQFPSLSVAVVRDGKTAYIRSFGFEDIKARRKATPESSYNVASVTKAFTASLAVILHDRGVVDLDQPAVKYLPVEVSISTSPDAGAKITLRQLASHTSGLPRGIPGRVQSVEGRYELEPKRLYDHLANVALDFDPGADEGYSNLGTGLLGHVLERAAGKPFDQLLQELVCEPLHMQSTAIQVDDRLHVVTGYSSSRPRRPAKHSYVERLAPSGGLVASVTDLAKFLSAQMKPGLFTSEMLEQLHSATSLSDGSKARTGLGWAVRTRESVGRILKKNGGRNNCRAWIGFAPDHGVGVAVVSNCGGSDTDRIGYWLLERSVSGVDPKLMDRNSVVEREYAKVAPYTGVRWEKDRPIVRVQDRWSPLVSIDGIPIARIVEFSQKEFGEKARKRFAEDLVQVLSTMGHEPDWEVTLGLRTKDGQVEKLRVRMTKANRNLVYE